MSKRNRKPKFKTFSVSLIAKSFYSGTVEALSEDEAIERTFQIWRTECPHPFDQSDDAELISVEAVEVKP